MINLGWVVLLVAALLIGVVLLLVVWRLLAGARNASDTTLSDQR